MKRKDFTPKKELKDGKQLDTGRKRMNKKTFIQNTIKRLSTFSLHHIKKQPIDSHCN